MTRMAIVPDLFKRGYFLSFEFIVRRCFFEFEFPVIISIYFAFASIHCQWNVNEMALISIFHGPQIECHFNGKCQSHVVNTKPIIGWVS